MAQHEWVKSTLGHGEVMCKWCLITNREAAVIGRLNRCEHREVAYETVPEARGSGSKVEAVLYGDED